MTTYYFELKQCPACDCKFSCMQVGSCNTFGAKFYTDGFIDGPMHDEAVVVAACPNCDEVLWLEELPTIMRTGNPSELGGKDSCHVVEIRRFRLEQFEKLLSEKFWGNKQQERYIRTKAWWAANQPHRNTSDDEFIVSANQRKNLSNLLDLLHDHDPNDVIMSAEIYRQLGMFKECLATLKLIEDENYRWVTNTILRLANNRCSAVKRIESVA